MPIEYCCLFEIGRNKWCGILFQVRYILKLNEVIFGKHLDSQVSALSKR